MTTDVEHPGLLGPLEASGATIRVARVRDRPAAEAFDAIRAEITPRTRLLALSHVAWSTGNVLPVAELKAETGLPVLVDGAQSVGAIPVDVTPFDYYTVSGQKWLCGPEGTGALYVADPERPPRRRADLVRVRPRRRSVAPPEARRGAVRHELGRPGAGRGPRRGARRGAGVALRARARAGPRRAGAARGARRGDHGPGPGDARHVPAPRATPRTSRPASSPRASCCATSRAPAGCAPRSAGGRATRTSTASSRRSRRSAARARARSAAAPRSRSRCARRAGAPAAPRRG